MLRYKKKLCFTLYIFFFRASAIKWRKAPREWRCWVLRRLFLHIFMVTRAFVVCHQLSPHRIQRSARQSMMDGKFYSFSFYTWQQQHAERGKNLRPRGKSQSHPLSRKEDEENVRGSRMKWGKFAQPFPLYFDEPMKHARPTRQKFNMNKRSFCS